MEQQPVRILRRREVEARTGLARSSLYRLMSEGRFPLPVKLGPRSVGWKEHEVQAWIEALPTSGREIYRGARRLLAKGAQ